MYSQDLLQKITSEISRKNDVIESGYLDVTKLHSIYYEVYGNPQGFPIFIIHGGPGGYSNPIHNQLFDLNIFKLIYFDQRGTGRSKPYLELKDNNTNALIQDIESLRNYFKLDKINLFGSSWGTTLALAYSIKYPQNVKRILLRSVFLGRQEDINFLYEEGGASQYYPDYFEKYKNHVKRIQGKSLLEKYYKVFNKQISPLFLTYAAKYFYDWESSLVSVHKYTPKRFPDPEDRKLYLSISTLETHYFIHRCFFEKDNYILENTSKLDNITVDIVHGRQDVDCRPIGAYLLAKKLKKSKLYLVDNASHTIKDKPLWNALKKVANLWAKELSNPAKN